MNLIAYGIPGLDPNLPPRRRPRKAKPKPPTPAPDPGPAKSLMTGEGFHVFGRPHRLRRVDDLPTPVALDADPNGWLRLRNTAGEADLIDWYTALLTAFIDEEGPALAARVNMPGIRFRVADLGAGRWWRYDGRSRAVTLNWACAQFNHPAIRHLLVTALGEAIKRDKTKRGDYSCQVALKWALNAWADGARDMTRQAPHVWLGALREPGGEG